MQLGLARCIRCLHIWYSNRHLSQHMGLWYLLKSMSSTEVLSILSGEGSGEPVQICRHDRAFAVRMNGTHIASTRFW